MTFSHSGQTRCALPASLRWLRTRTRSPHFGQISITLETFIEPSNVTISGVVCRPEAFWPPRWCFLRRFSACTITRFLAGSTRSTSPRLPRSFPAMTSTVSPFLIFMANSPLNNFRRQRHDLHKALFAQLARHRAEDARALGVFAVFVQNNRRIVVKTDVRAVVAPRLLRGAHDDRLDHGAFLHRALRRGVLHGGHDHVADEAVAAARAAQDADHQQLAGAGVVGDHQP